MFCILICLTRSALLSQWRRSSNCGNERHDGLPLAPFGGGACWRDAGAVQRFRDRPMTSLYARVLHFTSTRQKKSQGLQERYSVSDVVDTTMAGGFVHLVALITGRTCWCRPYAPGTVGVARVKWELFAWRNGCQSLIHAINSDERPPSSTVSRLRNGWDLWVVRAARASARTTESKSAFDAETYCCFEQHGNGIFVGRIVSTFWTPDASHIRLPLYSIHCQSSGRWISK